MLGLHFTPTCVLLLVCSLHFTHSLHFTPGPQSAVYSPQSAFYADRISNAGYDLIGLRNIVASFWEFAPF